MRLKPFRWYSLQELCCLFILIAVGSLLLIGISNQYLTERHSFHDGNSSLTHSRRLSNRDLASNIHQLDRRKNCFDSSCNSNISVYLEIIPESSIMRNSNNMVVSKRELTNPLSCSGDPVKFPFLDRLYIDPPVNFKPNLNLSEIMEYYATVPYETIVIAIQGVAKHCYAEARLTDKHGSSRLSNYTLGLGLNEVVIKVVDRRSAEDPPVLNTYTLHVYRQNAAENQTEFDDKKPHQTCYLAQDCGLWYTPNERCGLQPSEHVSWARYVEFASRLKPCVSGSASGRWMVPCLDCRHNQSCFWKEAVWQPRDCNHVVSSRQELRQCLSKRKVLFIGDSTNRGMMHYMMEQVNGSLMESDKTHDSKVYTNINDNRTVMSFAYYPQFWMPSGQRPVLTDALSQLLAMTMPLENNGRTVLVVGGVHWLAIQHLYLISDILHRSGLSNILVIIKTLGSGFHQTVEGLHHLTLEDQRDLAVHNSVLIQHATSLGFEVIDTFNMTMARYRDFLPGKCACHFHRVKEVLPSFMQFLQHSSDSSASQVPLSDMPIKYHVGGDINAIYSEILINIICRNR